MSYINLEIIINVWLAMLVYNVLLRAAGSVLLNAVIKGKAGSELRRAFKEKLEAQERKAEDI
jgi:hypothetical protein